MLLLIVYVLIALGFSFFCSVAEAVMLSISRPYISVLQQQGHRSAHILERLKQNIDSPLAAILTLNTTAHTIGAAGAGAQAAEVFGSAYVGVASAVLTLLILVLSEIIPKTLGALYWRQLAPFMAYALQVLIWVLYPFVRLSALLTRLLTWGDGPRGHFHREEFQALAEVGVEEGKLAPHQSHIVSNLLLLGETRVIDVMTPRSVVFSLNENLRVLDYVEGWDRDRFSRIPVYREPFELTGFVLRSDLLLAHARGNSENPLSVYRRDLPLLAETVTIEEAFDGFLRDRSHIMAVIDEEVRLLGILTLEDILETILGIEIVDEGDKIDDMRKLARRLWKRRAEEMGLDVSASD